MMLAAPKSLSESVLRAAEPLAPLEGGSERGVLAGGGMGPEGAERGLLLRWHFAPSQRVLTPASQ
jgi:hypothetical protein